VNAYSKPWLTVDQQIDRLRARGVLVGDPVSAAEFIHRVGYYRLVGYLHPFRARTDGVEPVSELLEEYRRGTSIDHGRLLMEFDRDLRLLVLDAVERIEVAVRTRIAHVVGRNGPFAHLEPASFTQSFVTVDETGTSGHDRWFERVRDRQSRSDETFVLHFRTRYAGRMPIWALTEILEFGQVARLFGGLANPIATEVAEAVGAPSKRVLGSWLASIIYVRNVAAHHARLFNRKLVVAPKRPAGVAAFDHLRTTEHPKQVFGVYGALLAMAVLLERIDPECDWNGRLRDLFTRFPDVPGMGTRDLGAPSGWESEPVWSSAERS